MTHTKWLLIVGFLVAGCNGSVGNNVPNKCTATFTGAVTATSNCQLDAVYASGSQSTSVAFSGALMGSADTWGGLSFGIAAMPATGTYDFTRLTGVGGDLSDASGNDVWSIAGGAGVSPTVGALSFMISSAQIATTVAQGSVYTLHGFASARMKYTGTASGDDIVMTIGF